MTLFYETNLQAEQSQLHSGNWTRYTFPRVNRGHQTNSSIYLEGRINVFWWLSVFKIKKTWLCKIYIPLTQHLGQLGCHTDMQNHSYFFYDTANTFQFYRSSKWWEVMDWGESVSELMTGSGRTITRNCTQYSLTWVFLFLYKLYSNLSSVCNVASFRLSCV